MGARKWVGIVDAGLKLAAMLAFAVGFAALPAEAAQSDFTGSYAGVGRAAGMSMLLYQAGGKVTGEVADGRNAHFRLSGRVGDGALQGSLYNKAGAALFRIDPKPSGLAFLLVPVTSEGKPNAGAEARYSFARARAGQAAKGGKPPRDAAADALAFVLNYRSWSPSSLVAAYQDLDASDRALINVFDHVQADVMVRLCEARAPEAALRSIAQNQRQNCLALERLAAKADRKGGRKAFDRATEDQTASLVVALRCRHKAAPESACGEIGRTMSRAAVHWSNAGRIFASLAGEEAVAMGTAPLQLASVAPPTEEIHSAPLPPPPPRARSRPLRVRTPPAPARPRSKPLLIPDDGGTTAAVGLDDAALAGTDQSAEVAGKAPRTASEGSFGFELRPTPSERAELSQNLGGLPDKLAGKRRKGEAKAEAVPKRAEFAETSRGRVPLPRMRPASGG